MAGTQSMRALGIAFFVTIGIGCAQTSALSCPPAVTASPREAGWCLMQQKRMPEAAAVLVEHLAANPGDAEVSYWIGQIAYQQYEKEADPAARRQYLEAALFHFARASVYNGRGALPARPRSRLETFVRAVYKQTYVSDDAAVPLEEVFELARTKALPPSDLHINAEYKNVP
jgi:hypothetical protein